MANKNLTAAKNAKNDEFYTQLTDIEKELMYYKEHFRDKVVFCNCDDPTHSNFWKYFHLNFEFLGLKKLIATHFDAEKPTYKLEYEGGDDLNMEAGVVTPLTQNGDFRSPECIELLKEADIVVTNPPFSLFREYVSQLMEYGKKFVIIGNMNAITYKEFFPLLKENKVWLAYTSPKAFLQPDGSEKKFGNVVWYTNLDIKKRHEPIDLVEKYSPEKYPKYDNYDAIEVSKTLDIPMDYDGVMGVPISFFDKYCPEQFVLIGATESEGRGFSAGLWEEKSQVCQAIVSGKRVYKRIFIKRNKMNYTVGCVGVPELMDDIRRALDAKALFSALALSFALVDECAKIEYSDIKSQRKRFEKWAKEYLTTEKSVEDRTTDFGEVLPVFDEEEIYQLRCCILHEASSDIDFNDEEKITDEENRKVLFTLILDNTCISCNSFSVNSDGKKTIDVEVSGFVNLILHCVEVFYKRKISTISTTKEKDEIFNKIKVIDYTGIYVK